MFWNATVAAPVPISPESWITEAAKVAGARVRSVLNAAGVVAPVFTAVCSVLVMLAWLVFWLNSGSLAMSSAGQRHVGRRVAQRLLEGRRHGAGDAGERRAVEAAGRRKDRRSSPRAVPRRERQHDVVGERRRAGDVGAIRAGGRDFHQVVAGADEAQVAVDRDGADGIAGREAPPIVVVGSAPLPPTIAPGATVRPLDEAIEPFTINVPALTLVAPV